MVRRALGSTNDGPDGQREWSEGHILAGRYELGSELGRGGMGVVYAAEDLLLERPVAVKLLFGEAAQEPEIVTRFQREALAAGKIGHENICDVRDRGEAEDGSPFIVMEKLVGQPLDDLFECEGRVEIDRLCKIVLQVLAALEAAHAEGIIHRDLKPANIFVTRNSAGEERIKLLDFGISKFTRGPHAVQLTRTGAVLGTPLYMSPEQALGQMDIDQRSDLWSTGTIMYEGLCGTPPFVADSYNAVISAILTAEPKAPSEVVEGIPAALDAVLLKALEKNVDDRWANAAELAESVRAARGRNGAVRESTPPATPRSSIATFTPSPVDPLADTQQATRSRALELVVLLGLVGALIVGSIMYYNSLQEERVGSERSAGLGRPLLWAPPGGESLPALIDAAVDSGGALELPDAADGGAVADYRVEGVSDSDVSPDAAIDLVEVTLLGIPDGAVVTFSGEPLTDQRIRGVRGRQGTLRVIADGYMTLTLDFLLREDHEVDLGEHLVVTSPRPGKARVRPSGNAPPPTADSEGDGGFVGGRHRTKVMSEYPGE